MNKNHPSQTVERKSDWLVGKKIWVGVTGSIAAVEVVGIVRELLRYGAEVRIVASKAALELVGEKALEFACGQPIVKGRDLSSFQHLTKKSLHPPLVSKMHLKVNHHLAPYIFQ